MPDKRGALIVIEGSDASGKETQTRMSVDRLKRENIPCETISFPRYDTPTGRIIGQCYLGKDRWGEDKAWFGDPDKVDPVVASLYYAADRAAARHEIKGLLASGINLISNRYYHSNLAHQGGKIADLDERVKFFGKIGYIELTAVVNC